MTSYLELVADPVDFVHFQTALSHANAFLVADEFVPHT